LQNWYEGKEINELIATATIVDAKTSMRDVMEIRYHTDHSVIIKDEQKTLGVIGDKELYHSLLGKMLLND